MTNTINSFDDIEQIQDLDIESLEVKAWNGATVYFKPLSSDAAETVTVDLSGVSEDKNKMIGMRTNLVKRCLCDQSGKLLVTSDAMAKKLGEKSSAALKEMFEFCMEMNGFSTKVEEAEKN